MESGEIFQMMLLLLLIVCAVGAALSKKLLTTVIIFMSYSGIMAIVWALLQSPDLAITEAAVGAGVSSVLFFVCLRRLGQTDREKAAEKAGKKNEEPPAGEGPEKRPGERPEERPGEGPEERQEKRDEK